MSNENQEAKKKERRVELKASDYYSVEGGKLLRRNRFCPKCGVGFFMAKHKDRHVCGRCGFVIYESEEGSGSGAGT